MRAGWSRRHISASKTSVKIGLRLRLLDCAVAEWCLGLRRSRALRDWKVAQSVARVYEGEEKRFRVEVAWLRSQVLVLEASLLWVSRQSPNHRAGSTQLASVQA